MKTFFLRCFALSRLFVFATLPNKRDVKKKTNFQVDQVTISKPMRGMGFSLLLSYYENDPGES